MRATGRVAAVRAAAVACAIVALARRVDAKPSNPAFLGISMVDAPTTAGIECAVEGLTHGAAAEASGIRPGDFVLAIDRARITTCDSLLATIQLHQANDRVVVTVRRDRVVKKLKATLWPRDEVLRRRGLIGQPPTGALSRIDDRSVLDLATDAHSSIIGWYSPRCSQCEALFEPIAKWVRDHPGKGEPIRVIAALEGDPALSLAESAKLLAARAGALPVPLFVAAPRVYEDNSMSDPDRVYFMVVDCEGVVRHLAPVVPAQDDTDAALDELFAAAEQSGHRK